MLPQKHRAIRDPLQRSHLRVRSAKGKVVSDLRERQKNMQDWEPPVQNSEDVVSLLDKLFACLDFTGGEREREMLSLMRYDIRASQSLNSKCVLPLAADCESVGPPPSQRDAASPARV